MLYVRREFRPPASRRFLQDAEVSGGVFRGDRLRTIMYVETSVYSVKSESIGLTNCVSDSVKNK